MPRLFHFVAACILTLLAGIVPVAGAQPLADKIPADAMLYVGWRGADGLAAPYAPSRLKQCIGASNIPAVFTRLLPQVLDKIQAEGANADEMKAIAAAYPILWKHPVALYVTQPMIVPGHPLQPYAAILCDAGADAGALSKSFGDLAGEMHMTAGADGTHVWLVSPQIAERFQNDIANPLAKHPAFVAALGQVAADGAIVAYFDAGGLLKIVNDITARPIDPNAHADAPMTNAIWAKVPGAFGLTGLTTLSCSAGFDGPDWITRAFIGAPAPRDGLLKLLDSKPLSDDALKIIPKSATNLTTLRFDPAELLQHLRAGLDRIDPTARRTFEQVLGAGNLMLGVNIEQNLLAPLGDTWMVYRAPDIAGGGELATVLACPLDDPQKAAPALAAVDRLVNTLLAGQLRRSGLTVKIREVQQGDLTIHYAATPLISPSWLVDKGVLYMGLYPESVAAAATFARSGAPSILENESFQAVRKSFLQKQLRSVDFADLPKTASDVYALMLLGERAYMGFADLFGLDAPALVLPPMDRLRPILTPAGGVTWTDDAGWHLQSRGPFPESSNFAGVINAAMNQYPALFGGMYFVFARERGQAQTVVSASYLRQIGVGIMMYANDHKGMTPPDLGSLIAANYFGQDLGVANLFISPNAREMSVMPADLKDLPQWVNQASSYVYVLPNFDITKAKAPGMLVVAYDKFPNADGTTAAAYLDGHVTYLAPGALEAALAETEKAKK